MATRVKMTFAVDVNTASFDGFTKQEQINEFMRLVNKATYRAYRKVLNIPKESSMDFDGFDATILGVMGDSEFDLGTLSGKGTGKVKKTKDNDTDSEENNNDSEDNGDDDTENTDSGEPEPPKPATKKVFKKRK
jgi:hypothetical protein